MELPVSACDLAPYRIAIGPRESRIPAVRARPLRFRRLNYRGSSLPLLLRLDGFFDVLKIWRHSLDCAIVGLGGESH